MTQEISIKSFYEGKEIFITGANGLIGKFLVEKLLRSCPGIKKIFLLFRSKKGFSAEKRFEDLKENLVFNVLKEQTPKALDKLEIIEGDCSQIGLGISQYDLEKLKNVSIVIHSAASVSFTDPLKKVLILNTRGTREVCQLAENLNKLVALVYVSTAYINPSIEYLKETVYPMNSNWRNYIKLAENIDAEILKTLEKKLIQQYPNTYAFSKNLAEQVCIYYNNLKKLPVIIYRPSIVSAPENEPKKGFIDVMNGVFAMQFAYTSGLSRTVVCNPESGLDSIPVDICVKGIIVAVWKKGTETNLNKSELEIYNSAGIKFITCNQLREYGLLAFEKRHFKDMLWKPYMFYTRCKFIAFVHLLYAQIAPAFLIDFILKVKGQKPIVTKMLRLLVVGFLSVKFILSRPITFENSNFQKLNDIIPANEKAEFFLHETIPSLEDYLELCYNAILEYIFKQTDEESKRARNRYRIIKVVDFLFQILFYAVMFYVSLKIFNIIFN